MTWNIIDDVQRAVTLEAGKSELRFFRIANGIMVIHLHNVSRKVSRTVFKLQRGHKYITEITIFKVQRAITPKVG